MRVRIHRTTCHASFRLAAIARRVIGTRRSSIAMRVSVSILVLASVLPSVAAAIEPGGGGPTARRSGVTQSAAGTRTTPDGKQVLISKDVGNERWAISMNLDDGTVTGNVFRPDAEPSFVWCERTGDDGSLDPVDGELRYACRGAAPCASSPCDSSSWSALGDVALPGSFFLPAEDPFSPLRTHESFCDDTCHFAEFLQVGEHSYSVDSAYCNYVTMVQPTRAAIAVGDPLLIRFWHFTLTAPDPGRAYLAIQIGDRIVWEARLPIPCRGGLTGLIPGGDCIDTPGLADVDPAQFVADFAAPAGTPIYVHVQNHGENNYSLVEASVNGSSLIDHATWLLASRGVPVLPPSGIVPPRGPMTCVPNPV